MVQIKNKIMDQFTHDYLLGIKLRRVCNIDIYTYEKVLVVTRTQTDTLIKKPF